MAVFGAGDDFVEAYGTFGGAEGKNGLKGRYAWSKGFNFIAQFHVAHKAKAHAGVG